MPNQRQVSLLLECSKIASL
uniref:Uncharacterized protein n=1 Tax=Zea mays TaxID=4577 RepID=C0PK09_MAIZE|nr:unknown [Zea mays]